MGLGPAAVLQDVNEERAIRTLALLAGFGLLRGAGAREKWLGMASMSEAGVQALCLSVCLSSSLLEHGGIWIGLSEDAEAIAGRGREWRGWGVGGDRYALDVFVSFCVVSFCAARSVCTVGGEGRFWACTLYNSLDFLPGLFFTLVCLSI